MRIYNFRINFYISTKILQYLQFFMKVKDRDIDQNTGLKSRQINQVTIKNIFKRRKEWRKMKLFKKTNWRGKRCSTFRSRIWWKYRHKSDQIKSDKIGIGKSNNNSWSCRIKHKFVVCLRKNIIFLRASHNSWIMMI